MSNKKSNDTTKLIIVVAAISVLTLSIALIDPFIKKVSFSDYFFIAISFGIVFAVYYNWTRWFGEYKTDKQIKEYAEKEIKRKELELSGWRYKNLKEGITKKTKFAADMQESMAAHAKPRANTLFRIGFGLMLLSFLFPAGGTYLYYSYDLVTNNTIKSTEVGSKNKTEENTVHPTVQPTRDWHILVAGITFGFLCLAVARGILLQQSSEMKSYFEIGQKARYFERLNSMVQVILEQDESTTSAEKEAIDFLKESLLVEPKAKEDGAKSEDTSLDSKMAELLKSAPIPKLPTE